MKNLLAYKSLGDACNRKVVRGSVDSGVFGRFVMGGRFIMIYQDNIERKDFSIALPGVTNKLRAVSDGMMFDIGEGGPPPEEVLNGWYQILMDVIDDLSTINTAFYSS
jgi:hypothetical protein